VAHVKVTKPNAGKLDNRSTRMVMIGYEAGSKAYRVYDPIANRVHVTRDAVFEEGAAWDWSSTDNRDKEGSSDDGNQDTFVVEEWVEPTAASPASHASPLNMYDEGAPSSPSFSTPLVSAPVPGSQGSSSASQSVESSSTGSTATSSTTSCPRTQHVRGGPELWQGPLPPRGAIPVEFMSPSSGALQALDADDNSEDVHRFRVVDNLLYDDDELVADKNLLLAVNEEPTTYGEAAERQEWKRAMVEELKSITDNKTWTLTDTPLGKKPIGLKWVFKLKRDADGNITRYKARLMVKGYVQRAGIDFDEVFAPVARLESVRFILAIAAHYGWTVHHLDVKSAFLNGDLVEEVYVEQPPRFVVRGKEGRVYKLHKALYGLRQAPRA
jgi:hypothetical protein